MYLTTLQTQTTEEQKKKFLVSAEYETSSGLRVTLRTLGPMNISVAMPKLNWVMVVTLSVQFVNRNRVQRTGA